MISKEQAALLNQQIAHESHNEFQYVLYAAFFENLGLMKLSKFFDGEAKGEHGHFEKVLDYARARRVVLTAITPEAQSTEYEKIAELYLQTEEGTTAKLKTIMTQAKKEGDELTQTWIQDLLIEQVEEEDLAGQFKSAYAVASKDWSQLELIWKNI
jgi:ferritin